MNQLKKQYNQLIKSSIKDGIDASILEDISESIIDSKISDSLLEEVPLVKLGKSIVSIGKSFHDIYYIKKFLNFFSASSQKASSKERLQFINKLSSNNNLRERLYERILISIDRIDEAEKAEILGVFFLSVVKGNLSVTDFIHVSWIVENLMLDFLKYFLVRNKNEEYNAEERAYMNERIVNIRKELYDLELNRVGLKSEIIKTIKARHPMSHDPKYEKDYKINSMGSSFLRTYWNTNFQYVDKE